MTATRTGLPPLVAAFVERNLPSDASSSRVCFSQTGEMQLKPGRWRGFTAEQEAATGRVEFCWRAQFPLAPLVALRVGDWYRVDDAALEVRLLGVPLKRMRGPDVARGEAMRYLAELPWVPQACMANRDLAWRELDKRTVEVAMDIDSARAAMQLHFDDAGDIVGASAPDRPRAVGKDVVPTPFGGEFSDYQVFNGIRVPTAASVWWELTDGPFVYFRGRVTSYRSA